MDLIADIGATNARFALVGDEGQELATEVFHNADFTGVAGLLSVYLDHRRASDRPLRAAIAVAAPITGDEVRMTNIDWQFSQAELGRALGLGSLIVVNDFAAVAWGLPHLEREDVAKIGGGERRARAACATIGPGSGTGVGAIVPASDGWAVVSGEGGHATLAPTNDDEAQVAAWLRDEYGNASIEHALSGPGLVNLYHALAALAGRGRPTVTPADVTGLAKRGEPLALKARGMFFALLGAAAGDLALTTGAQGGVFIAGGIVPRMLDALAASEFRARFEAKGAYRDYMTATPTYAITAPLPAFRGLKRLLGYD
jgi:glucokinase